MPAAYALSASLSALHRTPVMALAFSPCSNYLASVDAGVDSPTAASGSHIVIWRLNPSIEESARTSYFYAVRTEFGTTAALWPSSAAGLLISGSDGSLTVIRHDDAARKIDILSFIAHRSSIRAMGHSPDGATVVTASSEDMAIWGEATDPSRPRPLTRRLRHRCSSRSDPGCSVLGITWVDDDCFLIAYENQPCVVWNAKTGDCIREFSPGSERASYGIALHRRVVGLCYDGMIELYCLQKGFLLGAFTRPKDCKSPAIMVHNGRAVLHGGADGELILQNAGVDNRKERGLRDFITLPQPQGSHPVTALASHYDDHGLYIAAASRLPSGRAILNIWTSEFIYTPPPPSGRIPQADLPIANALFNIGISFAVLLVTSLLVWYIVEASSMMISVTG